LLFFCNFLLQLTFFASCLSIDLRRMAANRVDILCCIKAKNPKDFQSSSLSNRLFQKYYLPLLKKLPFQIIVILVFFAFFGYFGSNISSLKQDMSPLDIVAKDSPLLEFIEDSKAFNLSIPFFLVMNGDTRSIAAQKDMLEFVSNIQNMSNTDHSPIFWYLNFQAWLKFVSPYQAEFVANHDLVPEDKFFDWLTEFLAGYGKCHQGDVILNKENHTIITSRVLGELYQPNSSEIFIQSIQEAENIANSAPFDAYPYAFYYLFFSSLRSMMSDFLYAMIATLSIILILGSFLLQNLLLGFLCVVLMSCVLVGLFGLLPYFDITLNPIIVTNSLIAVGLSTEFFINITRAFQQSYSTTLRGKSLKCCSSASSSAAKHISFPLFGAIAASLTSSALSSLLAILPLHFADTPIISKYFFVVYFLIISMAYLCALCLLPSILLLLLRWGWMKPRLGKETIGEMVQNDKNDKNDNDNDSDEDDEEKEDDKNDKENGNGNDNENENDENDDDDVNDFLGNGQAIELRELRPEKN